MVFPWFFFTGMHFLLLNQEPFLELLFFCKFSDIAEVGKLGGLSLISTCLRVPQEIILSSFQWGLFTKIFSTNFKTLSKSLFSMPSDTKKCAFASWEASYPQESSLD